MKPEDIEYQMKRIAARWKARDGHRPRLRREAVATATPARWGSEIAEPTRSEITREAALEGAAVESSPDAARAGDLPATAIIGPDEDTVRTPLPRAILPVPASESGPGWVRAAPIVAPLRRIGVGPEPRIDERTIGISELMWFGFLEEGRRVGRCVGCIDVRSENGLSLGKGSGFLVSSRLLLTNNHVLSSPRRAKHSPLALDWVVDRLGRPSTPVEFELDPDAFFVTDKDLDFTLVAVATHSRDGHPLRDWGSIRLVSSATAGIGERVNIIQHPNGQPKQVALRANHIVDLPRPFIHYKADTAPGSSGAPVFNDAWELLAIHHFGVPKRHPEEGYVLTVDGERWRPDMGEHVVAWVANEGVGLDAIVDFMHSTPLSAAWAALWEEAKNPSDVAGHESAEPRADTRSVPPRQPANPATFAMQTTAQGITISVPLQITIGLGGVGAAVTTGTPPDAPPPPLAPVVAPTESPAVEIDEAVERMRAQTLGQPGVVRVRRGWAFEDGWITQRRAIVVEVQSKRSTAALEARGDARLPDRFMGHRVEVVEAWPPEVEGEDRLVPPMDARESTWPIDYELPEDLPLEKITADMKAIFHVSPDDGWPQLRAFLQRTKRELVVAMYDFTAPHILDVLIEVFEDNEEAEITLVIQKGHAGGGSPKIDEEDAISRLRHALGERFHLQLAAVKGRGKVWKSAYHIKVAVRDGEELWLSSGNWQSSGQPDADPVGEDWQAWNGLNSRNREWHAIVANEALARTFRDYVSWDRELSERAEFPEVSPSREPELFVPEGWFQRDAAFFPEAKPRFVPALRVDRELEIQPLLTPDNYWKKAAALVRSAKNRVWFQNQTLKPLSWNELGFYRLLDALRKKQRDGLDVRIIFRDIGDTRRSLEAIADFGFDMEAVKVQSSCHTKGIVVDETAVLLGSHNWSEDGALYNRDASLIVYDAEVTRYFAAILDWDWETRARQKDFSEMFVPRIADPQAPPPAGHRRVTLGEYLDP